MNHVDALSVRWRFVSAFAACAVLAAVLFQPVSAFAVSGAGGFVDTAGHAFEKDAAWLAAAGITKGCNPPQNDRFCPDDPVTRGQMAAFLTRALGLTGGHFGFIDTAGHVFEKDVSALAEAGITRGCNPP